MQRNLWSRLTDLQVRNTVHSPEVLEWDTTAGRAERFFQGKCRTNRNQSVASSTIPDAGAGWRGTCAKTSTGGIKHCSGPFMNAIKASAQPRQLKLLVLTANKTIVGRVMSDTFCNPLIDIPAVRDPGLFL